MGEDRISGYVKGLLEVADGVHAYLQPDGGWGWSNAGLIAGADASLLVDTLFDLPLTAEMLQSMAPITCKKPISTVVNTHANGDHCYGNQLVAGDGVAIVASTAAASEMDETPPALLAGLVAMARATPGELGDFVVDAFGAFEFDGIEPTPPTETFSGSLTIRAGDRPVELREVGPAHTSGDVIAWLPDERVLFSGDILFIGGTPIMWAGPASRWIEACHSIEALNPSVIVPGHGPLAKLEDVAAVARYLAFVETAVIERHRVGMDPVQITRDLDDAVHNSEFAHWRDRERLAINVETVLRTAYLEHEPATLIELFERMASLRAFRGK